MGEATTDADSVLDYITKTELLGLQSLAAVARCCQTHALSSEVQAALGWIADVEEAAGEDKAPTGRAAYICRIEDPASGSSVAFGATEDEARKRALARFVDDFGTEPSSQSAIQVYPRSAV